MIIEANEILKSNEQLTQEIQQLQIVFQKMKINHQNVKLKNKQLIKKNNDLKNEIKVFRKKFLSKFENDEKKKQFSETRTKY